MDEGQGEADPLHIGKGGSQEPVRATCPSGCAVRSATLGTRSDAQETGDLPQSWGTNTLLRPGYGLCVGDTVLVEAAGRNSS